ncbi:hypothetical protein [Paraburkholderia heleia]|uniref:hypothetical protein n=1 Tax=Paraburkholderia heleia TaxID=634127 RepID=UPI002AB73541|nr:hypothetical protein [Paraburkholderia heleia]
MKCKRIAKGESLVGRIGEADEVAQAVLMAVGNGFVTGQTIAVNGGAGFIQAVFQFWAAA